MRGDGSPTFNKDGSLKIDTRSIAFIPVKKIAVPEKLNLEKTPMLRASPDCNSGNDTFYYISMNFFPSLSHNGGGMAGTKVGWPLATEYATNHPEYFALTQDGKRACDLQPHDAYGMAVCPSGGAQDLVYAEAEKVIADGAKTITIGGIDGYGLCQCNCEDCNKLFGMKAENWDQFYARGRSGKLWQAFFKITERLRKKYPDVKIVILNYQDTPISADIIKKFPVNVIPEIQFASQADFDIRCKGVEFPAGICGFEDTFTGFGQAGPYLPERTPEYIAGVVQAMARNHVKWSSREGCGCEGAAPSHQDRVRLHPEDVEDILPSERMDAESLPGKSGYACRRNRRVALGYRNTRGEYRQTHFQAVERLARNASIRRPSRWLCITSRQWIPATVGEYVRKISS